MSFNLFAIPAGDQSIFYLGQIFGSIGGVLPATNSPLLLGLMFKVLNTAALSLGAMIVVYTTVAGLLSTASEGEFLGKKWSGLWVPVRTVLGIIGLFPSSGGYCAIQVIIMWLIMQGIGLADTLWTSVLNFTADNGGSPYASVSFPDIKAQVETPMRDLFTGLVCYESLAATYEQGMSTNSFYNVSNYSYLCTSQPSDPRCGAPLPPFDPAKHSYDLGAGCGKLTFCDSSAPDPQSIPACTKDTKSTDCINGLKNASQRCYDPNSLGCVLCKAQVQALPELISVFDTIAKKFVALDYDYQKFYYTSKPHTRSQTPQWIQNFCNSKDGVQDKCCVSNSSLCSKDFFDQSYQPNDPKDLTSTSANVIKDIYVPYGILPYTNNIDFIAAAQDQYIGALTGAYMDYVTSLPPTKLAGWQLQAKNNGWILAGIYYFTISKANANAQVDLKTLPAFGMKDLSDPLASQDNGLPTKEYRNNIHVMGNLFTAINQAAAKDDDLSSSSPIGAAKIGYNPWGGIPSMLAEFMRDITGSSNGAGGPDTAKANPLYSISAYGYKMMITTQILFWTTVIALFLVASISSINFQVLGTGMTASPYYEGAKAIWGTISPFWILMISALFSIGAILGIYLPLIPYIVYTMGAVGWLMATIEAVVAGPIIALGILSPSGQHELLGKSEPAVMIIFNLILRPSLMVFGMMASMLLAVVAVTMINQGFAKLAYDIISAPGLVEGVVFMIAYTSLLVMVLNKVFSLIHAIPEKFQTYIGGQAMSYGESEGLAGMKQSMEGGASAISGGSKEAGGALAGGKTKIEQDKAHAKSAKAKDDLAAKSKPPVDDSSSS